MAIWLTPTTAREAWEDAPEDDATLERLLEGARDAVLAYAPSEPGDESNIPARYVTAQLRHARNVWRSEEPEGLTDPDAFVSPARFRDLDASIRELIRPRRALGPVA